MLDGYFEGKHRELKFFYSYIYPCRPACSQVKSVDYLKLHLQLMRPTLCMCVCVSVGVGRVCVYFYSDFFYVGKCISVRDKGRFIFCSDNNLISLVK